eukprot:scpid26409/ scgid2674/ Leucine-rich repeat and guanylate kinase domain-containing protein
MSATLAESQVLEPRGLAVPSLGSVDASNNTPADQHPKRDGHDQIAAGSAPAAVTSRSAVGLDVQNDNEDGHSEPWKWTEKDFRRIAGLRIDDSWMDIDLQLTEDALAQPSEEAERKFLKDVEQQCGSSYIEYVAERLSQERTAQSRTPGPLQPYMTHVSVKAESSRDGSARAGKVLAQNALLTAKLLPSASDGKIKRELHVSGRRISDLELLRKHHGLQYIDASHNMIQSIGPLANMPDLYYINMAHNHISSLRDFDYVQGLNLITFLDLSHNKLTGFPTTNMPLLRELRLQGNQLDVCPTFQTSASMRVLMLQDNSIHSMAQLNTPHLEVLNLANNYVEKIENLTHMAHLKILDLTRNNLTSLAGIENCVRLEQLLVTDNPIHEVKKLESAWHLPLLWNIDFSPELSKADVGYRRKVLGMPWKSLLVVLDEQEVTSKELTEARLQYNPPVELWAVQRFSQLKVKRFTNQMVQPSHTTMPGKDTSYPMLILVGPPGTGKKFLCQRLLEDFSEFFGFGVSHTTRPRREHERDQEDYYFVSDAEFTSMTAKGEFIEVSDLWGHHYGLSIDEVERHASRGLATVTHMELDGALQMRTSYINPRLVMVVTRSETVHEERMWQRSCYRTRQIQHAVQKTATILKYHNEHPSTFDIGINSDELDTAHQQLCNLVQDYLGLPFDPLSVSRTSGATSCADDTTVMSSVIDTSTSTLDTLSRRTTPASGMRTATGTGTTLSSTPSSYLHHRNVHKWSIPTSSRGSSTGIDKSSVLLLPHDGSQVDI